MTAAGIEPLTAELEAEAGRAMRRAVDRVPDWVPVTKILTESPIRQALAEQLRSGRYDLVVLGAPAPGARLAAWRGRLARSVARRSDVPVLVVHPDPGAEPRTEPVEGRARAAAPLRAGASG
jgi:nucleotide-binding universal stress UspA family protein